MAEFESNEAEQEGPEGNESNRVISIIVRTIFLFQTMTLMLDHNIVLLLGLFRFFIYLLVTFLSLDNLQSCLDLFPKTLYSAKKIAGLSSIDDLFSKWVVCTKCHTLYRYEDSFKVLQNGRRVSQKCSFVPFPNHTFASGRKRCGARLLNKVLSSDGKFLLNPRKVYCQRSIKDSLQSLLNRPGFKEQLLRNKESESTIMTDICDGELYKTFKSNNGELFFNDIRNLGAVLNVDWFQPFKNTEYSLGVIYMAITNLPRDVRFKLENIIVCGIIPGPKEPKLNINTYLKPIVDELEKLWRGFYLNDGGYFGKSLYKFAVICLSSDIPATRKCGGFLGFGANKGIEMQSNQPS